MLSNDFICEEMCLELLLNKDVQSSFSSNDLKFGMFIYYTCVDFWKKFKIKFHLFRLNKVWKRKCIQSLIFNSIWCECYIINLWFCIKKLNGNWFGKDNGLSTCKPRFKLKSQQQPYIDHVCWVLNIDYICWLVNVDHIFYMYKKFKIYETTIKIFKIINININIKWNN